MKEERGSDFFPEGIKCGVEDHVELFFNSDEEL